MCAGEFTSSTEATDFGGWMHWLLEYGYDSAGIAVCCNDGAIAVCKKRGCPVNLAEEVSSFVGDAGHRSYLLGDTLPIDHQSVGHPWDEKGNAMSTTDIEKYMEFEEELLKRVYFKLSRNGYGSRAPCADIRRRFHWHQTARFWPICSRGSYSLVFMTGTKFEPRSFAARKTILISSASNRPGENYRSLDVYIGHPQATPCRDVHP